MSQAADRDTAELQVSPALPEPTFAFQLGDQKRHLTFPQAFAFGYSLCRAKKFEAAAAVFERLAKVTERGPRSHIMHALCKAGLADFKGAKLVLDHAFAGEERLLADAIQEVIVESRIGIKDMALRELITLVNNHHDLPTLCLWLGDLLETSGDLAKARRCWKLAVKRDRPDGAVALVARQQLHRTVVQAPPAADGA